MAVQLNIVTYGPATTPFVRFIYSDSCTSNILLYGISLRHMREVVEVSSAAHNLGHNSFTTLYHHVI